nr:MAG TPA: hypothetical protein [Caudoviricetes sp.]
MIPKSNNKKKKKGSVTMVAGITSYNNRGGYYSFSRENYEKWQKELKFLEEVMVNMSPNKIQDTLNYTKRLERLIEENKAAYAAILRNERRR